MSYYLDFRILDCLWLFTRLSLVNKPCIQGLIWTLYTKGQFRNDIFSVYRHFF